MIISRFVLFESKKIRIFVRKRLCFKKKVLLLPAVIIIKL